MIKKTIGKLRRQPKSVREGVAFWVASGFAFVVFSVWILNMPARFANMTLVSSDETKESESFFDELKNQAASVVDALPGSDTSPDSVGLGNESLDTMVNQFRGRSSSSAQSSISAQASSTRMNNASSTTPAMSESAGTSAEAPREVKIITFSSSSASTSAGR